MKILLLTFSLVTFLAFALGKLSGYDYQQTSGISLQESLGYATAQHSISNGYQHQQQQYYAPVHETYKKQFLIYSAPEEEYEDPNALHKISSALEKNVRVLFIRAPEQKGLERAALQLAKHVLDDKTAIYVLHKQADIGDLANRLAVHREQYNQKPQVHFIKYRTPEDAAHAQQQIQAQYDTLRGDSYTSNEGAAPVLDFSTKHQQQQQPIYGNAISVVPAYAGVSNAGNNLNGLYTKPLVVSNVGLGGASAGSYGTTENIGVANTFSSLNTVGYNSNTVTNTNTNSYGDVGAIGAYNSNELTNTIVPTSFNGFGDARATNSKQILAENAVSHANERPHSSGKFTFPSEGATDTYLPSRKST